MLRGQVHKIYTEDGSYVYPLADKNEIKKIFMFDYVWLWLSINKIIPKTSIKI